MFFLYCTEIAMFRFRGRSGISDYKIIFNAIILTKIFFSCMLRSVAFYIRYKMGRFRFGGRLRGLKSKLLINKMIKMHIRCKMGRFRFGGRLRGLKV